MAAQRRTTTQRTPTKKRQSHMKPAITPLVLTFDQACAALNYGEYVMRKIIREGRITTIREGRFIRIPLWAIEEYTRQQAAASMMSMAR